MSQVRLYLFSAIAIDSTHRQNHIEPHLLIDTSPQSAAEHGRETMMRKYPGCSEYQIGVVHEVPQQMIEDIKRLL